MQSKVSTAGEEPDLARMVKELKRELSEAHRREAATAEVLKLISQSPNQLQPILDAMLQTAACLCEAELALFFRLQDGRYHLAGSNNAEAAHVNYLRGHPISLDRGSLVGRTALERRTVHLPDCLADPEYTRHEEQRVGKYRSMLGVPLLRDGVPIGVIGLQRTVIKPFTDKQIELVTTFADQAVIAIENTRLLNELRESLQQQIATADVLKVISRSPTDVLPVFETIVENVVQLGDGVSAFVYQFDGDLIHLLAHGGSVTPEALQVFNAVYPLKPSRMSVIAQTILDRTIVHVRDFGRDPDVPEASRDMARAVGHRSLARRPSNRGYCGWTAGNELSRSSILRPGHRAGHYVRRPGRDRHRERAAVRGGAGAQQ
jgi:putative methionine-R-sulfoxide reductase with GAF domain